MQDRNSEKVYFNLFTGFERIVQILIEHGANINATYNSGRTALFAAVEISSERMVKLLIENEADVNIVDRGHLTASLFAVNKGKKELFTHVACKCIFLEAKALNFTRSKFKKVYSNLYPGLRKIVRILIENGANMNAPDDEGRTALLLAAFKGSESIAQMLIEKGADVNVRDNYNASAMSLAIESGKSFKKDS